MKNIPLYSTFFTRFKQYPKPKIQKQSNTTVSLILISEYYYAMIKKNASKKTCQSFDTFFKSLSIKHAQIKTLLLFRDLGCSFLLYKISQ